MGVFWATAAQTGRKASSHTPADSANAKDGARSGRKGPPGPWEPAVGTPAQPASLIRRKLMKRLTLSDFRVIPKPALRLYQSGISNFSGLGPLGEVKTVLYPATRSAKAQYLTSPNQRTSKITSPGRSTVICYGRVLLVAVSALSAFGVCCRRCFWFYPLPSVSYTHLTLPTICSV